MQLQSYYARLVTYNRIMLLKDYKDVRKIYFIGIGGISMSALAKLLSIYGYDVAGSDAVKGEELTKLAFYGVKSFVGEDHTRLALKEADLVVYTDAIPKGNSEYQTALFLRKKILSRMELLAEICKSFSNVITVAGSHGKTTCTSMCAHILKETRVPFSAHIGGEDCTFGNFYTSGLDYFLTEACEYKKNILKLKPTTALLLNIDNDHMECYQDENDLTDCFKQYCQSAKTAFVCADDKRCKNLGDFVNFGIDNVLADYRAVDLRSYGERYAFTVEEYGKKLCQIKLKAIGRHNVYNALGAFALMRSFGFHEREIKCGLENFQAVKRRFEDIGVYRGASFVCDYAHHPREIVATVRTAKWTCKGKLYVVFQPHTYSRTKLLMKEFTETLKSLDNLLIYKTFPAREKYDEEGSAKRLAENVGSLYADDVCALKTWLKSTVKDKDTVLFLGAGDIYYVAQYLLKDI